MEYAPEFPITREDVMSGRHIQSQLRFIKSQNNKISHSTCSTKMAAHISQKFSRLTSWK